MPIPGAALANIFVLLDLPSRPRIGHVGLPDSPLRDALDVGLEDPIELDDSTQPYSSRALDALVIYGQADWLGCQRVRPGGWVVILLDRASHRTQQIAHQLNSLEGARDIRRWLVGPSLSTPMSIIPRTRTAIRLHEIATRDANWKRAIRLLAIALGWKTRDFGGEVLAARVP